MMLRIPPRTQHSQHNARSDSRFLPVPPDSKPARGRNILQNAHHAATSFLLLLAALGLTACGNATRVTTPGSPQVNVPTLSPTTTTLNGSTPIYITDTTQGTTIIYTLDGSAPSTSNGSTCTPSSTSPCFTLLGGATVEAIAKDSTGNLSPVSTRTYTAPDTNNPCTGWNPQHLYQSSDFTADQATITSNGATLGVDCNGGAYGDYLNTGYGSFGNLIAVAYGRGFQTSIRDSLHSGFYNPTQAGIADGDGTPVTLSLTNSPQGSGGRINIAPYSLPLFLNGGFCFFPLSYYSPSDPNSQPFCNSSLVTDGIFNQELSANISATQQLSSEFQFSGYYQDAGNLGDNAASIFEFHFTMTYLGNPGSLATPSATTWQSPQTSSNYSPIYKFGSAATYSTNGSTASVLNKTYEGSTYAIPAYTDVANPSSKTSVTPTDTDMGIAQIAAGMRLRLTGGYTDYLTLNSNCDGWNPPQSVNLTSSAAAYVGTIYPAPSTPCGSVLALENASDPNAPIIAMYFPQTDPANAQQVTETNTTTGQSIQLDRRVLTRMLATTNIQPTVPYRTVNGIQFENEFSELLPVLRISGLLAPNHAGQNIDESVSFDTYVLVGSPAHVLTALQKMNTNQGWNW